METETLQYNSITSSNNFTNILLIDNSVRNYQMFVDSVNSSTFPIVYSKNSSSLELLDLLQNNFTTINRIGLCFNLQLKLPTFFLDNQLFFTNEEYLPYSSNVQFIINIIKNFNIKNIDYLGCNTLNYSEWSNYYSIIMNETSVIVGASNDKTGNILYGGDWVMESTKEDIEFVYFTTNIEYYTFLLDFSDDQGSLMVLTSDNTLYGTGDNHYGQLGLNMKIYNSYLSVLTNVTIPAGKTISKLAFGSSHTIILMSDNTCYGCGNNGKYQLNLLSQGSNDAILLMPMPTDIYGNLLQVKQVACGYIHSALLMSDNTVYVCGDNSQGQFGNGTTNTTANRLTLMPMPIVNNIVLVPKAVFCSSYSTIVLMTNNTVYGTGDNTSYTMGLGDVIDRKSLTQINLPTGKIVKNIYCGRNYIIMLMTDNTLYCCGSNFYGQLGLGDNNNRSTLTLMKDMKGTINDVSCGLNHTIILMSDGRVYVTGLNNNGQLGLGTTIDTNKLTYLRMPTGKTVKGLATVGYASIFLMTDGTIYGTGYNSNYDSSYPNSPGFGILGLGGTTIYFKNLTQIPIPGNKQCIATNGMIYKSNVCFCENTKILTNDGYKLIQNLRKGDLIKTLNNDFVPIDNIGFSKMYNFTSNNNERHENILYKCSKEKYPELLEDLIITGCHSILVDEFKEGQHEETQNVLGGIYITDKKYRLPACVDKNFTPYEKRGEFTIYHFSLENTDYYMNYGIYANGLLVETCSNRYLNELSNMTLIN